MPETNARIKVCHDTAANFKTNNPTLLVGEWALETDTRRLKVGDGSTDYNSLPYSTAEDSDEWRKPDDWIDIRSGALDNSVYFLVAHSKPVLESGVYTISDYAKIRFAASISSSGTYDVFVDGVKIATKASGTDTLIEWATLYNNGTLVGGFDIASPGSGNYTSHVVRITPSNSENTISKARVWSISGQKQQGVLWCHLELDNVIDVVVLLSEDLVDNFLCQAVTAKNNLIKYHVTSSGYTGLYGIFGKLYNLKTVPVLEAETDRYTGNYRRCFYGVTTDITIKNNSEELNFSVLNDFKGKRFETENPLCLRSGTSSLVSATNIYNLQKLPQISTIKKGDTIVISRADSLEPTFIDESFNNERTLFQFSGDSTHLSNLIGLIVSPEAPFDSQTSPQLKINYTNMSRTALVNLFKSMPYNVGYTVVGSPTIENGVLSDTNYLNRLDISQPIPIDKDLEVQIHLTDFTFNNALFYLFRTGLSVYVQNNGNLTISYVKEETGVKYLTTLAADISSYTGYWKIIKSSNNWTLQYSADGQTFSIVNSWDNQEAATTNNENITNIGYSSAGAKFNLNNTYIKVNGKTWSAFDGISRTVSVVGCTGAANWDETEGSDVRAIAENKGWEVTYR